MGRRTAGRAPLVHVTAGDRRLPPEPGSRTVPAGSGTRTQARPAVRKSMLTTSGHRDSASTRPPPAGRGSPPVPGGQH